MRADTVFQSGSLGKMFTAAAPLSARRAACLTGHHLRHLLNHTSGLGEPPLELQREYRDDELLALITQTPARFEPGQRWEYSNAGYALLGHGGTWQGFKTEMRRYDKDGVTFVVPANASHADVEHLLQGVAERYDARHHVQSPQPR